MIGVIADDLTGAAELAAVGSRHGLRAEIVREGARPGGGAGLACVDTDSRSCDAKEAARRAADAADTLRAAGAEWIYKKVDSVLRGNVIPEVEAVMGRLGLRRGLLLPANPSLGRVIVDGEYFIQGEPIHRTEFAKDPEHPRSSAQVLRLLGEPREFKLRMAGAGSLMVPEDTMLVGQTATSGDIREWVGASDGTWLPVGGAEFFSELLAASAHCGGSPAQRRVDFGEGRQLFICGSASGSSQALVKEAKKNRGAVFELPRELMWGARLQPEAVDLIARRILKAYESVRRVILTVGLPQVRNVTIARGLSGQLVEIAVRVLRQVEVRSVFAEGGATAALLVRHMNWPRLQVHCEWLPGVATLEVAGCGVRWLTIKPGSYAWPDEWTRQAVTA